jgi:uncharacterized protein YqjF (DUF2071 family)
MGQTWDDLLFVHYDVPVEKLRPLIPDGLEVQEHSGTGWLGVTPFVVTGLRARGLLPLPFASSFRELNVRTYVTRDDKPGIWFFSLDASSQLAVEAARRLYRLPYFNADISVRRAATESCTTAAARWQGVQRDVSSRRRRLQRRAGSLEHFPHRAVLPLRRARGTAAPSRHPSPPVAAPAARARVDLEHDAAGEGVGRRPLVHYSARQDVVIWPLRDA